MSIFSDSGTRLLSRDVGKGVQIVSGTNEDAEEVKLCFKGQTMSISKMGKARPVRKQNEQVTLWVCT